MSYTEEYTTSQVKKIMNKLTKELANTESFIVGENWYLTRYSKKVLIFNKVNSYKWVCLLDRLQG